MKTKFSLAFSAFIIAVLFSFGQRPTMELTFTAIDSASYVQLDSIKVMNRSQEGDTVLFWPDTVLILNYPVGIAEISKEGDALQIFQNYPNPVKDHTTITLYVPEKGNVGVMISDMLGQKLINTERVLERGYHSFRFAPGGGGMFFFTAYWKASSSSIKILASRNVSALTSSLEYTGSKTTEPHLKRTEAARGFSFSFGDTLFYIGYADTLQSGMIEAPETSGAYSFQFAYNIPCPGTPTVTYEGQVYNTVQIFSQCWLKENLNAGTMISGNDVMGDNGIIEKYCQDDILANCDTFGGLYQWREVVQYATVQRVQGICPDGWHIPTDEEWKILEGTTDSQYGIGDPEWEGIQWRGFDAGLKLKSTGEWNNNGNGTDIFGFSGYPWGYCYGGSGSFIGPGVDATWWTSSTCNSMYSWFKNLYWSYGEVYRRCGNRTVGRSVRCLKD